MSWLYTHNRKGMIENWLHIGKQYQQTYGYYVKSDCYFESTSMNYPDPNF